MSDFISLKKIAGAIQLLIGIGTIAAIAQFAPLIYHFIEANSEHEMLTVFFIIAAILALSFIVFYISANTEIPSFVIAIFFGVAAHPLLIPIVQHPETMGVLVGFGATLILFGGGLETPFYNFKKLFWQIFSLSFGGLFLTAFLFSLAAYGLGHLFGIPLSVIVAVLLGAVLASTDPAAIIPILKQLRFNNRATKDIIVSESAVTDVTGTLLTVVFLNMLVVNNTFPSITAWYGAVFSLHSATILGKQIFFGTLFGVVGYGLLEILKRLKQLHNKEYEADSALFLFIPVIIFTIALTFGGSGYLAAFIAGLLFSLTEHLHETERFFNHIIDGFFKPTIFILLGALVNVRELLQFAPLGIAAAFVFMFLIRPLVVFVFLAPFSYWSTTRFTARELFFISFVRETGAIPAVLMVTIAALKLGDMNGLVAVGMWVILATLIIEPLLTPWAAKKLAVAEPMKDKEQIDLKKDAQPLIVLGTRGHSFLHRLSFVADWARAHNIYRIMVLLCLEDKYTPELAIEIAREAEQKFTVFNAEAADTAQTQIEFSMVIRTGFLQDNINALSREDNNISAIFVGRKMLDYRLNEIKRLTVPIFFVE